MTNSIIQQELDLFEQFVIDNFLGGEVTLQQLDTLSNWVNNSFGFKLNLDCENLNKHIKCFEAFMKPLMLENGQVNSVAFKDVVGRLFPKYKMYLGIIPDENFRLVDYARNFSFESLIDLQVRSMIGAY